MTSFEQLVLEKLSVIERRITGIELQVTFLADALKTHSHRLTTIEDTCLQNLTVTPIPIVDSDAR